MGILVTIAHRIIQTGKCFGYLTSAKKQTSIQAKIVRAIIFGIAAETVPKPRGPKIVIWACYVLSPSLLHARVAHFCVNVQCLNCETKTDQLSQFSNNFRRFLNQLILAENHFR